MAANPFLRTAALAVFLAAGISGCAEYTRPDTAFDQREFDFKQCWFEGAPAGGRSIAERDACMISRGYTPTTPGK